VLRSRVSAAVLVTICSLQEAEFAQREAGEVVGGSPGDGGPTIEAQWPVRAYFWPVDRPKVREKRTFGHTGQKYEANSKTGQKYDPI
jgi:hypothetical protein